MIYEFGEFGLDLGQFQLRRDGQPVPVEPKVFDVLRYLVEHRDRVVPKAELLAEVWPNDVVTDAVLPNNVAVLRKALGQKRREKAPIETIHGRGYRFSAPVVVHEGTGGSVPPAGTAQIIGSDPFLARDLLIGRLSALRNSAQAGRGRICLVHGDAGMGKTRLLEELRAMREWGTTVHMARCMPQSTPEAGVPSLWPWIQLLRAHTMGKGGETPSAESRAVFSALLPELGAPSLRQGVHDFSVLDGLARIFIAACQREPHVLLIDDLHLADAASVQVLTLLAQEVLSSRLLVIATVRNGELPVGDPTREALVALSRPRGVERVSLAALSAPDVEDYALAMLGDKLPDGFPEALYTATQGTPMYVRDVLEGLLDTAGNFDLERYRERGVRLSDAAYDFARMKVAKLPEPVVHTLEAASVVGRSFRLQVLVGFLSTDRHGLLDQMDIAVAAGIVDADGSTADTYSFKHPFLHAAVYEGLPAGMRVRTHRRVADALAAGAPEPDHGLLCSIAEHYYRSLPGHDPDVAIDYACRAGRDATYAQRYGMAVKMYGLALEAVSFSPSADPRRRARILRWLLRSHMESGGTREARKLSAELLELTRHHRLHEEFAAAVELLASQERFDLGRGAYPTDLMDEALSRLPSDSSYRPRLLVERARCRDLPRERRAALLDEAQSLMAGDVPTALACQSARVEVLTGPDQVDELLEAADAAVAQWPSQATQLDLLVDPMQRREAQRSFWLVRYWVQRNRCVALLLKGDVGGADRAQAACEEVAEHSGWPLARYECGLYRMGRLLADADIDAATACLEEVRVVSRTMEASSRRVALAVVREHLLWLSGQQPMVTERDLASLVRDVPGIRGETLIGTGWLAMQCGFTALAERIFDSLARDGFRDVPLGTPRLASLCELAFLCASIRAVDCADALRKLLEPHSDLCAVSRTGLIHGPVARPLAELCSMLGRHDAAVEYGVAALTSARAMRATTSAVQAALTLAAVLLARAGEGDRAFAIAELDIAQRLAERHGLPGLVSIARQVRATLAEPRVVQA